MVGMIIWIELMSIAPSTPNCFFQAWFEFKWVQVTSFLSLLHSNSIMKVRVLERKWVNWVEERDIFWEQFLWEIEFYDGN